MAQYTIDSIGFVDATPEKILREASEEELRVVVKEWGGKTCTAMPPKIHWELKGKKIPVGGFVSLSFFEGQVKKILAAKGLNSKKSVYTLEMFLSQAGYSLGVIGWMSNK